MQKNSKTIKEVLREAIKSTTLLSRRVSTSFLYNLFLSPCLFGFGLTCRVSKAVAGMDSISMGGPKKSMEDTSMHVGCQQTHPIKENPFLCRSKHYLVRILQTRFCVKLFGICKHLCGVWVFCASI
jgi:hypothetical protein